MIGRAFRAAGELLLIAILMVPAAVMFVFGPTFIVVLLRTFAR